MKVLFCSSSKNSSGTAAPLDEPPLHLDYFLQNLGDMSE